MFETTRKLFYFLCSFGLLSVLPAAATEYHVSVKGNDSNKGTSAKPFRTIHHAAQIAKPGDIITVHAGVYRERIDPPRGGASESKSIVFQAAKGEKVEIKGSEVVNTWTRQADNTWKLALPDHFFGAYNPYTDLIFGDWFFAGRRKVHTGEVYLNGKPLFEVDSLQHVAGEKTAYEVENPRNLGSFTLFLFNYPNKGIDPASAKFKWYCSHEEDSTFIYANFQGHDPNNELTEINVRPACFYPSVTGINFITIRGFSMSQAATQWAAPTAEQIGLIGTNWSKGWVIEDNIISDSKCVGITLGKDRASGHNVWFHNRAIDGAVHYNKVVENVIADGWGKEKIGSHIVRRNTIFRCAEAGICGSFGAAFSTITDNHIYDIYTYRTFWGAEMGGIKLHAGIDVLIKNNRIHNSHMGIWLDWMTQGTRISSNLFYDNDFVDAYFEVNHGPYLVDNNLFLSDYSIKDMSEGGAFVHNLIAGLLSRDPQSRTTPYFKPNSTKLVDVVNIQGGDNRYFNNIFIGNAGKSFYHAPYGFDMPNGIDSISGYGTVVYEKAKYPVMANNNVYLYGAYPLPGEKNKLMLADFDPAVKVSTKGNTVELQINIPGELSRMNTGTLVNTNMLGKTVLVGQGYTNPDASALEIDRDYLNNPRKKTGPVPGPFEIATSGTTKLTVWPMDF